METLIKNMRQLKHSLPKNKIKELQSVLMQDRASIDAFMAQMDERAYKLPEFPGKMYHTGLFHGRFTPYFDMIELMEYYPSFELK